MLTASGVPETVARSSVDPPPLRVPLGRLLAGRRGRVGRAATATSGKKLFVEAKAHIRGAGSPPSKASAESLGRIERALQETRAFIAPSSTDRLESQRLTRYANRLAFLDPREKNGIDAHLFWLGSQATPR